jgi:hypothetical protein
MKMADPDHDETSRSAHKLPVLDGNFAMLARQSAARPSSRFAALGSLRATSL